MSDDSTQLWAYALSLYGRTGVAQACLTLQDEAGADVCELLWACWLFQRGLHPAEDIATHLAEVRDWQSHYTYPLRAQRRALKPIALHDENVAQLRETIKRAELLAEREALARLARLAEPGRGVCRIQPGDTLDAQLRHLIPALPSSAEPALTRLIDAASAEPSTSC
ncbi:TIGR02444 family protein [Halomonas sp. McH1-25]|uniref:TIGR02444 family protein n=1 Tax=unclassified Halomonas TaxID=2609666 RepID=UPI001EF4C113|nr:MULTISPECIES: TIGR02444 family protein [unclassified Halomonas]MCG7599511.1 TIGR02444 family protein [Halomonas sp. McH1-25]MCP1343666.1 TIGR02444 family protein [Halomonas sp. FL8]MCP1361949.1 TIGR02444 family protein [Halomonas sp. BBD45]MCP1366536.1 TIGR02444 family protein [Halomonas sp. BBD48]